MHDAFLTLFQYEWVIVLNYVLHFVDLEVYVNLLYLSYYPFDVLHYWEKFIFGNGFYCIKVNVITFLFSFTIISVVNGTGSINCWCFGCCWSLLFYFIWVMCCDILFFFLQNPGNMLKTKPNILVIVPCLLASFTRTYTL